MQIGKMRNYLINIHRFYHYPNSFDHAIMPAMVFSLTINLLVYIVDCILLDGLIFNNLRLLHRYMVVIPFYITLLVVYFWYRSRVPSIRELKEFNKGIWLGVIICGVSLIGALIVPTDGYN